MVAVMMAMCSAGSTASVVHDDGSDDDGGDGRDGDSDDGSDDGVELGRQYCQHCGDDCHGNTASTAIRTAIVATMMTMMVIKSSVGSSASAIMVIVMTMSTTVLGFWVLSTVWACAVDVCDAR